MVREFRGVAPRRRDERMDVLGCRCFRIGRRLYLDDGGHRIEAWINNFS